MSERIEGYFDGESVRIKIEYDKDEGILTLSWEGHELVITDVSSLEDFIKKEVIE